MASEEIVLRSPVLDNVVKMVAIDDYPRRRPGKNSLNQMGTVSFGGSVDEYNGMHKLVLITDNSNPEAPIYKVCVCDGATYDPETQTSKASSRVDVHGLSFEMKSKTFDVVSDSLSIGILFTASTETTEASVEYTTSRPTAENQRLYYIGSVSRRGGGVPRVSQSHTSSIAEIYWGVACNVFYV